VHSSFIDFIIEHWRNGKDWGVVNKMKELNYPLLCFKTSIVNHIGRIGLHSGGAFFDTDVQFTT